jgi:hypothetical protein
MGDGTVYCRRLQKSLLPLSWRQSDYPAAPVDTYEHFPRSSTPEIEASQLDP